MFFPNKIEIEFESLISVGGGFFVSSFGLAGRPKSITFGLLNVVVNIKKVINRKPKSTIGVISTLVFCFLERTLPPLPPFSCTCTSAISIDIIR
ncbi:hypothetical protein EMIT036CA2_10115 [Chryseobacterium sp. IT-36CA2]